MKIALLGGTFDPIHNDHLAMAEIALSMVDRVEFLPAGQPWQKPTLQTSAKDRLAMLHLAVPQHCPNISINTLELDHQGPSYTIETLEKLTQTHTHAQYYWIMGADQLRKLSTWYRWQDIFNHARLLVFNRDKPFSQTELNNSPIKNFLPYIQIIPFASSGISSTHIRQLVQKNQTINHLVPSPVAQYIYEHQLYR